jgi:uncharacterized membrane protein YhaH (DUF805 family)
MRAFFRHVGRTFRHFADFRGRSTRTEFVVWYVFSMLLAFAVDRIASVLAADAAGSAAELIWLPLLLPTFALVVRRLHDGGWSGWLALIGLPGLTDAYYGMWMNSGSPYPVPHDLFPPEIRLVLAGAAVLLFVLLVWNDQPGPNRWGPNPRYDAPLAA